MAKPTTTIQMSDEDMKRLTGRSHAEWHEHAKQIGLKLFDQVMARVDREFARRLPGGEPLYLRTPATTAVLGMAKMLQYAALKAADENVVHIGDQLAREVAEVIARAIGEHTVEAATDADSSGEGEGALMAMRTVTNTGLVVEFGRSKGAVPARPVGMQEKANGTGEWVPLMGALTPIGYMPPRGRKMTFAAV